MTENVVQCRVILKMSTIFDIKLLYFRHDAI